VRMATPAGSVSPRERPYEVPGLHVLRADDDVIGFPSPPSTRQTHIRSESVWRSMESTRPATTPLNFGAVISKPSP
jgi:hypothetical protein